MARFGSLLAILGILNLSVGMPLYADVIPLHIATPEDGTQNEQVCDRLQDLGIAPWDAAHQTSRMTPEVLAHYSETPATIQVVAGLEPEELWLGLGFFASVAIIGNIALQKGSN